MQYKGFNFKYYNLEEKNPFEDKDDNASLWWGGEKLFYENISEDGRGDALIERIKEWYDDSKAENELSGIHLDPSISERDHLLVFYLDLWHGKWFPYDSFDVINEY